MIENDPLVGSELHTESNTNGFVVVLERGGRDSQKVARAVRKLGVYSEIWPFDTQPTRFDQRRVKGVVIVKSGYGVTEGDDQADSVGSVGKYDDAIVKTLSDLNVPVLYGKTSEVIDGENDEQLRSFLFERCDLQPTWTMRAFAEDCVRRIKSTVNDGIVLSALSGGVDSAVASALVHAAIGSQLRCIFVDHGFLRKGEAEQVADTFRGLFGRELIVVDAEERFLSVLAGVGDPEEKRKRIGEQFIRVFEEEAAKLGRVDYLLQGTLYPDVIESGIGGDIVKSHHNVGGLPEEMELDLLEPLRYLFKDEVRALGTELGLPEDMVQRQPFPGPGLAIRIMGSVDRETLAIEREADAIVVEEIERAGLTDRVWQYFAVVTESRSVGVGDHGRTYGRVAAVRAVEASDGTEATWAKLPYEVLDRISTRMMTEIRDITRVVYDISSKPPSTIEWE